MSLTSEKFVPSVSVNSGDGNNDDNNRDRSTSTGSALSPVAKLKASRGAFLGHLTRLFNDVEPLTDATQEEIYVLRSRLSSLHNRIRELSGSILDTANFDSDVTTEADLEILVNEKVAKIEAKLDALYNRLLTRPSSRSHSGSSSGSTSLKRRVR